MIASYNGLTCESCSHFYLDAYPQVHEDYASDSGELYIKCLKELWPSHVFTVMDMQLGRLQPQAFWDRVLQAKGCSSCEERVDEC